MIYDEPILGKMGVFSNVSKKMVFGICADSKKECLKELVSKIGPDAHKYRWSIKPWTSKHIGQYKSEREEYQEAIKRSKERKREYLKAKKKIDLAFKTMLTSKQQDKFIKSGRYPVTYGNYEDSLHLCELIISGEAYKEK